MVFQNRYNQAAWRTPERIGRLCRALQEADVVVIGAGAGLSASAGFVYHGKRFRQHFKDFEEKYGFHDMYTGGFYPYDTAEEYWAYWSRYIMVNRYMDPPKPVYQDLLNLVQDKDYFVLTTNVDHCFQKAGFDPQKLFYTQGDYGLFQCSGPCCQETWKNEDLVRQMVQKQQNGKIPTELLPHCPVCGNPLTINLRSDDKFVQDIGWLQAAMRYETFLRRHQQGKILYWELGVGYHTPSIIKYPFWQRTIQNPQAIYVCVNQGQADCPEALQRQAICLDADIGAVLSKLLQMRHGFGIRTFSELPRFPQESTVHF